MLVILTVLDQNYQLQGPHPIEICNHIQQLYLDAGNVWRTTYFIMHNRIMMLLINVTT